MAWTTLKAAVASVVKTNGNQEITGANLQTTLNSIIDAVGANAPFVGIATPTTNPGTPDGNVFYIATEAGTYSNFGAYSHTGGIVILLYSGGSWSGTNIYADAPADGTGYVRNNNAWVSESGGGSADIVDYQKYGCFLDVFRQTTIRNLQKNNFDFTSETRWTITNINTTTKVVTFDRALPSEIVTDRTHLWSVYSDVDDSVNIVDVDYDNNTITYDEEGGTLTTGVCWFFNPFASLNQENNGSYLTINNNLADDLYNVITTIWKNSNGKYYAWILGWQSSLGGIFLAESTDMITWTGIDGTWEEQGVGDFNKSYMTANETMFTGGNSVQIEKSNVYNVALSFYDGSAWNQCIMTFDEDGTIIRVSDGYIEDCNQGGLAYYKNKYYFYTSYIPDSTTANRVITEYILSDLNSMTVEDSTALTWTKGANNVSGSPLGSHTDQCNPVVYNGSLYLIFSGSGDTGIHATNRSYQVAKRNEDESFNFPASNPFIINPIHGQNYWYEQTWNWDHMGAFPVVWIEDGKLYLHITMNGGTNTYQPALLSKDLT